MNQFKIQNSKFKLNSATHKGWGFYLPWETRILSLRDALAFAPLAGEVLNLHFFHKQNLALAQP
ncbi:hypothetical protein A6769_26915 [Nostoc punctiforme NIES-2108]|uniref:Uncharacterized protein n=1 Tax=Nostoc punctiforme NIES-2108 TaxID=1356359 RepID=A0A367RC02_NOSPU|nr:hypothetical protein A6769_26915 [Nostoc punctiforme NIES-2108]